MCNMINIREMHIKTTMSYHFKLSRIATVKQANNNKCWPGCGKLEPLHTAGKIVKWYSHIGKPISNSQNVKQRVTICPSNSTSRYIPKRTENMSTQKLVA